ncbi:MAG: hypothetical protein E7207_08800 [Clostridium butyricum]|nr:hypothetical protein [Clostridium butyricum]
MEELRKEIDNLKTSLSKVKDKEYKECFNGIFSVLNIMSNKIEELLVNQETMEEKMQYLDEDVSGIQDELFEEVSIDELNDIEDEYTEINCIHCNKPIFIEKSALENNAQIPCPYCHKNIKEK